MRMKTTMAFLIAGVLMLASAEAARTIAPLHLLAENAASGSQVVFSEEATSQQDPPVAGSDHDTTTTRPEPEPADPPEQDPPPGEHGQDPEPEPAPPPPPLPLPQ